MSGRWGWGERSEDPNQIHEGRSEGDGPRREASRWDGCELPCEESVQNETDWEIARMDEANTMFVQNEALFAGLHEPLWAVGMHGLRQKGTTFSIAK